MTSVGTDEPRSRTLGTFTAQHFELSTSIVVAPPVVIPDLVLGDDRIVVRLVENDVFDGRLALEGEQIFVADSTRSVKIFLFQLRRWW